MIAPARQHLLRDTKGATVLEFALITPPLLVMLMGLFDLAYNQYTSEMLNGAIQKAARDSTIEAASASQTTIDARVTKAVQAIAPSATMQFDRKAYSDFTRVNRSEDYDDVDGNGACDKGEPFEDVNGNGLWDADTGTAGFGGARDAVLYTVTVTYRRAFPIYALIPGQTEDMTLRATTVLRNQPYGAARGTEQPAAGNCE